MAPANDVSPDHYAGSYQVWDFVIKIPLGYLEGNTVKYVTRWRKKDRMKDLEKAMHYLEKLIEVRELPISPYHNITDSQVVSEIKAFSAANELTTLEVDFLVCICQGYLNEAHETLKQIIDLAGDPGKLL